MSDDYSSHLGVTMHPGDFGAIGNSAPLISPEWDSSSLYAPIDYTPPSNSYSHVPTSTVGDHGAEDLNAKLIREQYDDYQRRFQPFEDLAVSMLTKTGTKDLPYDLARTRQVVGGVFGSLQGQQDRAMERFGQANRADNIAGSNAEAGALVGGLNAATFADQERRMKLLGGGTSTAANALSDANGGGN
jgi:hypothetical protein